MPVHVPRLTWARGAEIRNFESELCAISESPLDPGLAGLISGVAIQKFRARTNVRSTYI